MAQVMKEVVKEQNLTVITVIGEYHFNEIMNAQKDLTFTLFPARLRP